MRKSLILNLELALGLSATALLIYLHIVFMRHAGALWRDEVNSVQFAMMHSISEIWNSLQYDPFPLLSTLALRAWTSSNWAQTDFGLRFFGFMVGVLIVVALWVNARRLDYSIPFLSIALFGFAPIAIRFGDSIRPYGLGICFMLLTYGMIWQMIETPGPGQIILSSAVAVASVHCLYQNAFFLMALCLGGIVVALRKAKWKTATQIFAVGVACAFSLLPYLGSIKRAQDWTVVNQQPIDLGWIWNMLSETLASSGYAVLWIWISLSALAIGAAGIFLKLTLGVSEKQRELVLFAATAMITGTVAFLFFVRVASLPSQPWYYIPLMAFVSVSFDVIGGALARINWIRLSRVALFAVILALALPVIWQGIRVRQTNIDLVASKLEKMVAKDDMILVSPWYYGVTFHRYYKGKAPWMSLPPMEDLQIHRYDLLKQKLSSQTPIQPILDRIASTLKAGHRVWVVRGLLIPTEDQTAQVLPPAPAGPGGWNNYPYMKAWVLQVCSLVKLHALRREHLPLPSEGPLNPHENVTLEVIQGWH